ncbi:nitrogen fixation protein NifQ [Afifella aestuarii]|uniref:nitrogen fixation protein NifQ n=1 Tax=Afifella aestuarii TaxID=1909496 RepID=UPI00196A8C75|nr:nitrogen fixation protein NifQ [Afifella aestuarii]
MDAAEVYDFLMEGGERPLCNAFDAHVIASVLALAISESRKEEVSVVETLGLDSDNLKDLVDALFPHAAAVFEGLPANVAPARSEDEACLLDLLMSGTTEDSSLEMRFAEIIARRCQRPNHLWQDLGLRNRRELGWLMERHFEMLSEANSQDMKWKKFFYRMICRDTGYQICTVPTCNECDDFETCFGDESGESLLARVKRDAEKAS